MSRTFYGISMQRVRLAVVALGAALLMPAPVWAHAHLVKSVPAAKSSLSNAPKSLRLWFSEAPELALTRITLLAPQGDTVPLGPVSRDPAGARTVAAAILRVLGAGTYRVLWRTAAADGHPTHGEFTFTVTSPEATPAAGALSRPPATPRAGPPAPTVPQDTATGMSVPSLEPLSPAYVAVRWLSLTALVLIVGSVAFRLFVLSAPEISAMDASVAGVLRGRTARMGFWVTVVLGTAALARLAAQSAVLGGVPISRILYHTTWGRGWLVQAGALVLTALGFVVARRPARAHLAGWVLAAAGAAVLAVTPALSGHAVATPQSPVLAVLADGGHVLGAGGWLGTLFVLTVIGLPAVPLFGPTLRGSAASVMVNRFSRVALVCATLTLVTGGVAAWLHLGSFPALWQTRYGQTLLMKLGVLAVVVVLGAYHWRVARPAVGQDGNTAVARLRRSASLEVLMGAVVLVVTAILVATPIPTA